MGANPNSQFTTYKTLNFMGYFTKQIAGETLSPAGVSLSGTPNYIELTAKRDPDHRMVFTKVSLEVKKLYFNVCYGVVPETRFTISIGGENGGDKITLQGTNARYAVDDKTFLLVPDLADTAENIRDCLLNQPFFKSRFKVSVPPVEKDGMMRNGNVIYIESLGAGELYTFSFDDENGESTLNPEFMKLEGNPKLGDNDDMIDYGRGNIDIEADVCTGNGDRIATLVKSYYGQPVWFDVNALANTEPAYSDEFLQSGENDKVWVDAGTATGFNLTLKTSDGVKRETFYRSGMLYAITGNAPANAPHGLSPYIYRCAPKPGSPIRPLSTQPCLPHARGQSQYFNFVCDIRSELPAGELGISYRFYSPSGQYIGSLSPSRYRQPIGSFGIVNTTKLNIDEAITRIEKDTGQTAGMVHAFLCRGKAAVSEPLIFRVLPPHLHRVHDFAFLNSLGGWSSFNFGGVGGLSSKPEANTCYKARLPRQAISGSVETVISKSLKETYTAKTLPVTAELADWLRELSSSIAVYEIASKRYVIVEEFEVRHNTEDSLFVLEMKYRYSDA
jgi:hypothetical protein